MTAEDLREAAQLLASLSGPLGLPDGLWESHEDLAEIDVRQEVRTAAVLALNPTDLARLAQILGDALDFKVRLGALDLLRVTASAGSDDIQAIATGAGNSPTVELTIRIGKLVLLHQLVPSAPTQCRVLLYLFPLALSRALSAPLEAVEALLWADDLPEKRILLVPGETIGLDGPCLAAVGDPSQLARVAAPAEASFQLAETMRTTARAALRWEEPWLTRMTPVHLETARMPDCPNESTLNETLGTQLANICLMYTAERTLGPTGARRSVFSLGSETAEVHHRDAGDPLPPEIASRAEILAQMTEWAYRSEAGWDRLPVFQMEIVRLLDRVPSEARLETLLNQADALRPRLETQWKLFYADKIEQYGEQVRALEDYVAATSQGVADQIAALIKGLSDTALAAVAALLASFIGALLKDKANPAVFRLGMLVYAAYVVMFPLLYGMSFQRARFVRLLSDFGKRKTRMAESIEPVRVDEITKTVESCTGWYWRWFTVTCAVYVLIAVAATVVGFCSGRLLAAPATSGTAPPP